MTSLVAPLVQGISSVASTLGSGLLNYFGTRETNEVNRDIAIENRQWQSDESQKEREYQMEMWDKNNAYNTPAAEMSRLREAGLNPYIGNSERGSGSSMPSPTSLQGAPNAPTMQNPFAAFDMRVPMDFMTALGQKKVADANSANQNAQSLTEVAKAAKELYDVFGPDKAMQMIAPVYGRIVGATFDGNNFEVRAKNQLAITQSQREIESIQAEIARKVGVESAEENLAFMKQKYAESVAQCGLWSSMADLNRAYEKRAKEEIPLLQAKVKESLSSAWHHFNSGNLAGAQALTENQKRNLFLSLLRLEVGSKSMDFIDQASEFESNEDVRDWLTSDGAKHEKRRQAEYELDPTLFRFNQFTGALGGLLNGVAPLLKKPNVRNYSRSSNYNWYNTYNN